MEIQDWINSGCDYNTGVSLYEKYGKNKHLLKKFKRSQTSRSVEKLRYELEKIGSQKVVPSSTPTPPKKKKVEKSKVNPPQPVKDSTKVFPKEISIDPERIKKLQTHPISFYPVELHPVYQERIDSFLKACSLKMQLNDLPEESVEEALEIQLEIHKLFEVNEKCWNLLKHYEETGRAMKVENSVDYSQLSVGDAFKERQRIYARISKRAKTLQNLEKEIKSCKQPAKTQRLNEKLILKKEELQELRNSVEALSKIIDS